MNLLPNAEQDALARVLDQVCRLDDPAARDAAVRDVGLFDAGALAPDDEAVAFRVLGRHLAPVTWLATALAAPLWPDGTPPPAAALVALAEPHGGTAWRVLGIPRTSAPSTHAAGPNRASAPLDAPAPPDRDPAGGDGGAGADDGSAAAAPPAGDLGFGPVLAVGPDETRLVRRPDRDGSAPAGFDPGTGIAVIGEDLLGKAEVIAVVPSAPILRRGSLLVAALLAGSAEASLQRSVAHGKQREQFGRPIGAFQAVAHRCADMAIRAEAATAAVHLAAAALASPAAEVEAGVGTLVAAARLVAADAALRNAHDDIQHHGALGFTAELDCHRHLKRAHLLELTLGGPQDQVDGLLSDGSAARTRPESPRPCRGS